MMLTTVCLDTSFAHSAPDKLENKEHMTEEIFTFLIHKSRQYIIWSTSYPHKFEITMYSYSVCIAKERDPLDQVKIVE